MSNMVPDSSNAEKSKEVKEQGDTTVSLLQLLEDYIPTIPDAVVMHHLRSAGVDPDDPRIARLMAIISQKFISDIANDTLQRCKIRAANQPSKTNKPKDRNYQLTMDDLAPALAEYGINVRKPPYFV